MRKNAAVLTAAMLMGALLTVSGAPAGGQSVVDQTFAAYGTGTALGVNAVGLGNLQALNAQAAFAGQSVNSRGLPTPIINELGYAVQPAQPAGKNAYARGTGLEVGLLTANPAPVDPNQLLLSGLAEANAPPPQGPVVRQLGPIPVPPLAFANLLRGTAQATFDPRTCPIGRPFNFGQGEAAGLQLINLGGEVGPNGELLNPAVGATLDPDRNVNQTRSFSYLIPNGQGKFGLVSETHQQVAPINLLNGLIQLELLGEWVLRTTATGLPGGARVDYAPVGAGPTTPVLTLTVGGVPTTVTLQQLLGPNGFDINLPGVLTLRIGTPPRPIGSTASPQPPAPVAPDGTSASAAVDVIHLEVLGLLGGQLLELRLGHMESAVLAPPGGITCEIPVSKTGTPDPVEVGQEATITISIPSDQAFFSALFDCDLIGIKVVDTHRSVEGNVRFEIRSASNGGVISPDGRTVTWENLGNYRLGDPPIRLQVVLFIPPNSPAGVLEDIANVSATLGNCRGGAAGTDLVGAAQLDGSAITGAITLTGPRVSRGALPPTGGDARLLVLGGGLMLGALFLGRRVRRSRQTA